MAGKEILTLAGAFSEEYEIFEGIEAVGHPVHVVCPDKKAGELIIYVDVPPEGAIGDGQLVSAKGWAGRAAFMRESLEIRHG